MWDRLLVDCNLATMDPAVPGAFGTIENGAIGIQDGRIVRVGRRTELAGYQAKRVEPLHGAWITPGLVDCHTHLVFGGNRAGEFEQRLEGASYEEIARAGGGIASTVKATRAASQDELVEAARPRLRAMMRGGVTTVEIKSGYGLDIETELKMLRAAKALGESEAVHVETTLLALHALPPEFAQRREEFVALATDSILPAAAEQGLATAVDAFCEGIGFTRDEVRAAAMARAHMVAVLLPGAFYALKETRKPPVDLLRRYGVPMAVATDCNPGTSPVLSPTLMMAMACTLFGLTPEEAVAGMTREGARALGLQDEIGTIAAGKAADLCIWRVGRPAELCYWLGLPGPERRIVAGMDA